MFSTQSALLFADVNRR